MRSLVPFQQAGSQFLQTHPHALLADEPGLGKTLQAIDAFAALSFKRALVVCPASVRTHWREEIRAEGLLDDFWTIVSYEEAVRLAQRPERPIENFDVGIFDEAHFLKTPESQRTQAIFGRRGLARWCEYKWALTGTPVLNRPRELFPILKCLASDAIAPYDTFASFAQRYCGAFFDGRGINTRGASRLDELGARLRTFMLRRTADEVGLQLPPVVTTMVPLELDEQSRSVIERAEAEILDREAFVSSVQEDFSALGDQAHLLHATGFAKAAPVAQLVADLLETQDKVVVFAHHVDVVEIISQKLGGRGIANVIYEGSDRRKDAAKRLFISDPSVRAIIGNVKAMGTGVDGLQGAASTLVMGEFTWVPGEAEQAIKRLRRMGQCSDRVLAYAPYVPGTMESAVLAVHGVKERTIEKLGLGAGWRN